MATAAHVRACYDGLQVDTAAMRANLQDLVGPGGTIALGSAGAFVDRALAAHALLLEVLPDPTADPATDRPDDRLGGRAGPAAAGRVG